MNKHPRVITTRGAFYFQLRESSQQNGLESLGSWIRTLDLTGGNRDPPFPQPPSSRQPHKIEPC